MHNNVNDLIGYTYNLKLLLFDDNFNLVNDELELDRIKKHLLEDKPIFMKINGNFTDVTIKWDKKEISVIDEYFMGDLFANPIYNNDSLIMTHTQQRLIHAYSKYNIKFHITRLMCKG